MVFSPFMRRNGPDSGDDVRRNGVGETSGVERVLAVGVESGQPKLLPGCFRIVEEKLGVGPDAIEVVVSSTAEVRSRDEIPPPSGRYPCRDAQHLRGFRDVPLSRVVGIDHADDLAFAPTTDRSQRGSRTPDSSAH